MSDKEKFEMAVTLLCEINEEPRNEELKGIINQLCEFDRPQNWRITPTPPKSVKLKDVK